MLNSIFLSAPPTLNDSFTDALATIKTDVMGYIGDALPVGLAIAGTFIAIRLAVRFFRGIAN